MSEPAPGAAFPDHFSHVASRYAEVRPTYPREIVTWLASVAPARDVAWDVGCGSGQMSTLLADAFARVVATDASAQQIAQAQAHPRVAYRVARADASGQPARSVDCIVAAQSAHWFELDAFYAEVRRVARPDAVIALISYGNGALDGEVGELFVRFYRDTLAGWWPPERTHIEAGYGTLAFPFRELAPPPIAMRVVWPFERVFGYVETWSATLAFRKAGHGAAVDAFRAEFLRAWGDPETPRELRWPFIARAGVV